MWKHIRPIGYMFASLILISSLITFAKGFERAKESDFWLHLHEENISLSADNPLLLTNRTRHPYFFLDTRTYRGELTWNLVMSRGHVFLLGNNKYILNRIDEVDRLAAEHGAKYNMETLTPNYSDKDGHSLIRLYNFSTGS